MEIVHPNPPRAPRAQLAILITALIVLVAGYAASRTSAFQWFLLNASLRTQVPASPVDHDARPGGLAGKSASSAARASRCPDTG